ncbi:FtsK/SpoIIIE domain-containing protein [Arthrobacter sp. CJ23]|uniref:FtsK/SpoIIIE domain-containing protein n=1 Tax=Arthrobacter sp. CJ23 TaxID=2972479 RepID=UPI00215C1959|nr:FtsK/SpoIIIE domain-containing protein [Arthrobacter sp. CJ23]UVJ38043.1 FtsK/SpoIIIE domain-containing protein [Arthrobacter sp. CJ23]
MPDIETAIRRLTEAQAGALGSLNNAETLARAQAEKTRALAQSARERSHAVARNRSAQSLTEYTLTARDAVVLTRPAEPSILDVASHIELGRLQLSARSVGVNSPIDLPCVVPLLGTANLVFRMERSTGTELIRATVLAALKGTAPGQLDLIAYDPLLAGVLAPFAALRAGSEEAVTVLSHPRDLEPCLTQLTADVRRIDELLRGIDETLVDSRARLGYPVERYQIVVFTDYPTGVDESTHRQIMSLCKAGPAAGISFIFHSDPRSDKPSWWNEAELAKNGNVLASISSDVRWQAHPDFNVVPTTADPALIVRDVNQIALAASQSKIPAIPFDDVQQTETTWGESSRDGLRFAVGRSGYETVDVVLGDADTQRHNALITGAVGQGKSNLLKVIIYSLCQRYSPDELELYLLDFKEGVTLYPLAATADSPDFLPQARVLGLESDRDFGLAVLRRIESEFARRAKLFRPYGDDIAKYRSAVPSDRMPRIVVMIDEFHLLFDPADEIADEAARLLEAIARRGRSYGVHLILASQTISGISALLSREQGLFAQFPIRIALKNNRAESFVALSQGNDAAARVRLRGQAVLNLNYGERDANQSVSIASADDKRINELRRHWWHISKGTIAPPHVFDGGQQVRPSWATTAIQQLRDRRRATGNAPAAVLGLPLDVWQQPRAITLDASPGRNLAVIGAGEDASEAGDQDGGTNCAIGVLHTAALSLALQHPQGDAEFVSLDLLDGATAERNNQKDWEMLMERLGFPIRTISRSDFVEYLQECAGELTVREDGAPTKYLIGFALDRAGDLEAPDMFANRPVENLQRILREGPTLSVHMLGWWSNASSLKSHLGFGGDGFIDALLMLRVDQATVQSFLGPFVKWGMSRNRGLLADRTQLPEPAILVPFAPVCRQDAEAFLRMDWDA